MTISIFGSGGEGQSATRHFPGIMPSCRQWNLTGIPEEVLQPGAEHCPPPPVPAAGVWRDSKEPDVDPWASRQWSPGEETTATQRAPAECQAPGHARRARRPSPDQPLQATSLHFTGRKQARKLA